MFRIFCDRAQAEKYTPVKDDTLESIIAANATCQTHAITWQELAMYNWATVEPPEVNRALVEMLGCALNGVDKDHPEKTKLDPKFAPTDGDKQLLIPKPFQKDNLAIEKTHTLKVRRRKPMPAVRITKLSPWFIPEDETCDISYNLEGVKDRANKLVWEVWASNYQTATLQAVNPAESEQYEFTFAACNDPIRKDEITDKAKKKPRPGADYDQNDWNGESKAANGILKPRTGKKRYVTVANSPYTVHYRFYKNSAHENAKIVLKSFWPRWKKTEETSPPASPPEPEIEEKSLKIEWKIENCTVLKHGQLLVWDKANEADTPVFRKALSTSDLGEGEHHFDWTDGKDVIRADRMPYRVQIQAHTGMDYDDGVALAAMHTEIRLYAPPELDTHDDPVEDPQCLTLELAPFFPKEDLLAANTRRKYQYQLATLGLHPGPVNGVDHDAYKLALKDFQRSYTQNTAAPFQRLAATGAEDGNTTTALNRAGGTATASPPGTTQDPVRPLFGDYAQINGTPDITGKSEINDRLKDPTQEMIVWIDDRHYYTDIGARVAPDANMTMVNYRGAMSIGDGRTDTDEQSTARPWVPVSAAAPLLAKADELSRNTTPTLTDAMRRAAGPLRVDWTFTDVEEDLNVIDTSRYGAGRLRSRLFVNEHVQNLKGEHEEKDATNCPETYGGIRPDTSSPPASPPSSPPPGSPPNAKSGDYYKKAFGIDDLSLAPWKAKDEQSLKRVAVLMHDDLGQDENKVFADLTGRGGVYFNLSRIAGDGYQFRARVCFEKLGGDSGNFLFPNHEVLRDRYSKVPQGHTCKLRNWRKTSFRGYLGWTEAANRRWTGPWPGEVQRDYRSAFVHFAYEEGARNESHIRNLYPAGPKRNALMTLLENNAWNGFGGGAGNTRFQDKYMWPWSHQKDLGVTFPANPGDNWDDYKDLVLNNSYSQWVWALILDIIHEVEQQRGHLRGHILVEFKGAPEVYWQRFRCGNGHEHDYMVKTVQAVNSNFKPCPTPACGRNVRATNGQAGPYDLISTAYGLPLGGSLLITLGNNEDHPWWTHEIGHNRHLEHAAGEGGYKVAQHDSEVNTSDLALQAAPTIGALWKQWDRVCTMSYTDSRLMGAAGGDDRQQFCGKCLLRNRGWKVEILPALATLGGNVTGP